MLEMKGTIFLGFEGTICRGNEVIPGASSFVSKIQSEGFRVIIYTNCTRFSTTELNSKLHELGINVKHEDVYNPMRNLVPLLKSKNHLSIFVIGVPSFIKELEENGFKVNTDSNTEELDESITAAVFAFDDQFNYSKSGMATRYAYERKADLYVCGEDGQLPWDNDGYMPGPRAYAAIPSVATYVPLTNVGKPGKIDIPDIGDKIYVIGDNWQVDGQFAQNINAQGIILLTGVTSSSDEIDKNLKVCSTYEDVYNEITKSA